jgi:hypothetical protein
MCKFMLFSAALLLVGGAFAQSGPVVVNCSAGASLQAAVDAAKPGDSLILRGICSGPVTITTDGLKLFGGGTASITGSGNNVVTVTGAQQVVLSGLTISGGAVNGLLGQAGAQLTLENVTVAGNGAMGIQLLGNSAAVVSGGGVSDNVVNGVDVESTSSFTVTGAYTATGNQVFGMNINGNSSLTLTQANLTVSQNTLGIQLGTTASGFIADNKSALTLSNNATDGLTVVSGSHMVDFGGTIQSTGNGIHGISINSKAGLDLDAGSQVTVSNNTGDGIHMENTSVMTIFNNPNFSGQPAATLVTAQNNQANGMNLETGSDVLVSNYAELAIHGNVLAGISLDDGSHIAFTQTIPVTGVTTAVTGNNPDAALTFAARATLMSNDTIGTATCDATVLVRGPFPVTCPAASVVKP